MQPNKDKNLTGFKDPSFWDHHFGYCHANYQMIMQRLPAEYVAGDCFQWAVSPAAKLTLQVIEQHRYTTILQLSQSWQPPVNWLSHKVISLMLYHDVQLAESKLDLTIPSAKSSTDKNTLQLRQHTNHLVWEWLILGLNDVTHP